MKIAFFDTHQFEKEIFETANKQFGHQIDFIDTRLTEKTTGAAKGHDCVCAFVNDRLSEVTLQELSALGVRLVALRSAGFNHVDIGAAQRLGIKVVRVPEYSPHAVAEHAVALIMGLNRKVHRAFNRVREGNFSLNGLVGFDLFGKTVGVIGTGKIGVAFAKIMSGFGCKVIAHDLKMSLELANTTVTYVSLDELLQESDVISLHVPLNEQTRHLIDEKALSKMKKHAMIINTGRGALIDTKALIRALKKGNVGSAGLDVYEEEAGVFFENLSDAVIQDDVLARLLTFPNVLLTSHQGFLTQEALHNIADTTLGNIKEFEAGAFLKNEVLPK